MKKTNVLLSALSVFALVASGVSLVSCGDSETKTEYVEKKYAEAVSFSATASDGTVSVSMTSSTSGAAIYYTTDSTTPSAASTKYSASVAFTADTTIKAIAIADGLENSPVSFAKVSISEKTVTEYVTVGTEAQNAKVGATYKIGDATYYVISNQLSSASSKASRAVESTEEDTGEVIIDTGDSDTDAVIEKFASDVYVRKFLAEVGITQYIQLWNPNDAASDKKTGTNGDASLKDTFYIGDKDGNKIATFSQSWIASRLIKNLAERGISGYTDATDQAAYNTKFNALSNTTLRTDYMPSNFSVITFPETLSDKQSIEKIYNYDKNGEIAQVKAYLNNILYNKEYQTVTYNSESKDWASYRYQEYPTRDGSGSLANAEYQQYNFVLLFNNSNFYYLTNEDYDNDYKSRRIKVRTVGTNPKSDTSSSNRQNQLTITFNGYTNSDQTSKRYLTIQSELKGTATGVTYSQYNIYLDTIDYDKSLLEQTVDVKKRESSGGTQTALYKDDASTKYTLSEAVEAYFSDYIACSEDTTNLTITVDDEEKNDSRAFKTVCSCDLRLYCK